ncbi:TPA: hypothetical protein SIA26_001646 [Aeromonas bestiarum]|nr:hypothetical protein [Aeromonas bestiarum]
MITGTPTKDDFYSMASHMVNEAWEIICKLGYPYNKYRIENSLRKTNGLKQIDLSSYWSYANPKLMSAFSLLQQSVEFRLKGIICDVSPYLLIANSVTSPPKKVDGNINYSDFYTLDAKDLLKVIDTFTDVNLNDEFVTTFNHMRSLRNSFMHSVSHNDHITFESIIDLICYMHKTLNPNDHGWFKYRYDYLVMHSSNGIDSSGNSIERLRYRPAVEDVEMFNVHVEFKTVIDLFNSTLTRKHFNYIKNNNKKRSYECVSCSEMMEKSLCVHAINDDEDILVGVNTVQAINESPEVGICVICGKNQKIPI